MYRSALVSLCRSFVLLSSSRLFCKKVPVSRSRTMDTSLKWILASTGAPNDLIACVEARGILSVDIYAELREDLKGV